MYSTTYTSNNISYLILSMLLDELTTIIPNSGICFPANYSFANSIEFVEVDESDTELTLHSMNLSEQSLFEEWENEDDEHWESFL